MIRDQSIVAVYASPADVEAALAELRQAGFDMAKVSISALAFAAAAGGPPASGPGLQGRRFPPDRILQYEHAIQAGKLVLIADVPPQAAIQAKVTISHTRPETWDYHS